MYYMVNANKDSNNEASTMVKIPRFKDKIILMLHDFVDSPHVYHWMLFDDLWQWAYETLEYCQKEHLRVVVKGHPRQKLTGNSAFEMLMRCFNERCTLNGWQKKYRMKKY